MSRAALVVDATVAIKWVLPEPGTPQALRILKQYHAGKLDLLAPPLLVAETHNVLWKRVRRGELAPAQARCCARQLLTDCPLLIESGDIAISALELAIAHAHPVYDCLYLALALDRECRLVTADTRFYEAIRPALPCIDLLDHW